MFRRLVWLAAFACVPFVSVAACSRESVLAEGPSTSSGGFGNVDSGNDGSDASIEASLPERPMCPVTTCSSSHATCPSSRFPCDVDLLTDDENCGACGVRCDGENANHSKWSCVDGKCTFSCNHPEFRNCDDNPTNGCEAPSNDVNNCGVCGRKCPAGMVCYQNDCMTQCQIEGAPDECPDPDRPGSNKCTNKETDDKNCAACGTVCDPAGPGLPPIPSPDMYYGCGDSKCETPKCKVDGMADCNFDLTDGCETQVLTDDNCRGCGDKCAPGQICFVDPFAGPHCICAPGETRCFGFICVRLDDDPRNCGGCTHLCPGSDRPHFEPTCTFGVCGGRCEEGFADCNGLTDDGCEVDTRVDNRNCGACGHACATNQVCSQGQCLLAPCESEQPGTQ